jgi:hypothetical protein
VEQIYEDDVMSRRLGLMAAIRDRYTAYNGGLCQTHRRKMLTCARYLIPTPSKDSVVSIELPKLRVRGELGM